MPNAYTARAAEQSYPVRSQPATGAVIQLINFTAPANTTANDTVELCKIPANSVLTDMYLTVAGFDTGSATATFNLGLTKATANEADVDPVGFCSAVASKFGAGSKTITPADLNGALVLPYQAGADGVGASLPADGVHSKLTMKFNGTPVTAGIGTVKGWIEYVML